MAGYIANAVLLATVCLIGGLVYATIYNLYISPLKVYPGPVSHAISRLPLDIARLRGNHHKHLRWLHDKYGPVARVAPGEVSTIKGKSWAEIYGPRIGRLEMPKADLGHRLNGVHGILTAPTRGQHRRQRRMLAHAFSAQGLREQENRINHFVNLLMVGLTERANIAPVDMAEWFHWTSFVRLANVAMDVIGDLAFGETFGCLESQSTHEWIDFVLKGFKAAVIFLMAEQWGVVGLLMHLIPNKMMEDRRKNFDFLVDKLQRRVARGKDRGDFWDHVLKHDIHTVPVDLHSPETRGTTIEEMQSCAGDLVLAGSETTATLLSGVVFHLLQNPAVRERVTAEVRTTFADESSINLLSVTPDKLPYMDATLQETMRRYPPVGLTVPRKIPLGGDTVDGVFLPENTRISIPHIIAYNSPYNFARPLEFLPERWLPDRPQEFANDNPDNVFQPFSAGPRNCIGMNLARAEMRLVLSRLLWRFDLEKPAGAGTEWDGWLEGQKMWLLWFKDPLMVSLKTREGVVDVKA